MNILIVSQYFWPENFRVNDLAVGLTERGHKITVFTGIPNYPAGKFFPGYGFFKKRRENYQGVEVIRYPLLPRGDGGVALILNYLSSAIMACVLAPFYCRKKYDLILVPQLSPVTIGLPAIVMKMLKNKPLLFWILDLWPESLSATGAVSSPVILSFFRKIVRFIYRQCDQILISSRGFVSSIETTGGYVGDIEYFPNWVEPEYTQTQADQVIEMPDLPQGFKIMFAGNVGAAQDFETILSAAEMLQSHKDIHWIILGDGRRFEWVKEQVLDRGLEKNFHLLGRFAAEAMPLFFAQADVMLVTLKNEPIFALTSPGKIQSYLASSKPILAALAGEGALIIDESCGGLTCSPEAPEALVARALELYSLTPEERQEMGLRGFNYCLEHFDREKLFDKLEATMEKLTGKKVDRNT